MLKVIFGMAEDRQHILSICRNFSEPLAEHIIKCIVYRDSTGNLHHWINEISFWLWRINNLKPKKGFRIKSQQYRDSLFIGLGTELNDIENDLEIFQDLHVRTKEYPEFRITDQLCKDAFNCYWNIADATCDKLGTFQSRQEVLDIVEFIIHTYTTQ